MKDRFPPSGLSGGAGSSCRVGLDEDILDCPPKKGGEPGARESSIGVWVEGTTVDVSKSYDDQGKDKLAKLRRCGLAQGQLG